MLIIMLCILITLVNSEIINITEKWEIQSLTNSFLNKKSVDIIEYESWTYLLQRINDKLNWILDQ